MQNLKLLIGVIGGTLALVFAVAFLFSGNPTQQGPQLFDQELVQGDTRHLLATTNTTTSEATSSGSQKKLVTLVEFSDFQCPACKGAQSAVKQIMSTFGDNLQLVYRHFPLESIHKNARSAAIAAEAASMQGKFWEYHDVLFETQTDWDDSANPRPQFEEYAKQVGLNLETFVADMESATISQKVDKDIQDAFSLGINSTPTFYVDNQLVTTSELVSVIESKIAQ